jgi:hypothetical protein
MGRQGHDHCARLDLWHKCMVALLLYPVHIVDSNLGIKQEALTYPSGL